MGEVFQLIAIAWLLLTIGTMRNANSHGKSWQRWGALVGFTGFIGVSIYGIHLLTN